MKNALIIASHYPPNPTGGVMRIAKLVKYLPSFGWNSIVLTSSIRSDSDELLKDVQKAVAVYRLPSYDVRGVYHHLMRMVSRVSGGWRTPIPTAAKQETAVPASPGPSFAARFFVPDHIAGWIPLAALCGIFAVIKHRVKVVYSTSPLPSSNLVAYLVSRVCRVPWVLDMRDPWTTNPIAAQRGFALLSKLEHFLEKTALQAADHVVVISEQFLPPLLQSFPSLDPAKFSVIPNGYDPEDFEQIEPVQFDRFTILHAGTFYEGRSATPFLEALRRCITLHPELREALQVLFLGDAGSLTASTVTRLGLSDLVKLPGTFPHKVGLQYISGADLLLLVPGPGKSTMTGKVFEYLAVRRPILALAGEGAVRDVVSSSALSTVVAPDDVPAIAEAIVTLYRKLRSRDWALSRTGWEGGQFDRREIAGKIAALFDEHGSVQSYAP